MARMPAPRDPKHNYANGSKKDESWYDEFMKEFTGLRNSDYMGS